MTNSPGHFSNDFVHALRKNAFIALLAMVFVLAPKAVVAQEETRAADEETSLFEVAGIRVIHRPSTGDMVVANLYLLGGVRQLTFDNAGIELMLLDASERGTRKYPKERLRRNMARLGTTITIGVETDWSSIGIRATKSTFDSTWAILASRVAEPTLDVSEVELVKRQFLLAVSQRQDNPDALAEYLADSVAFAGHPYAIPPAGTERSISSLDAEALRSYHSEQFVRSRMLLVVVGDISREHITALVGGTLSKLPLGSYTWTLPDTLPRRRASVYSVSRQLPTNYILGRYPGPRAGSEDYYALRIATAVLSGQLFGEIRSRRNLTYAVEAPFIDRAVSAGGLYVTTVQPGLTVDIMRQQLATVRTSTVDEDGLSRLIQQFVTQYFLENETHAEQADFLAKSYLYENDYRAVGKFEQQLRDVTPRDIQRVARQWIRDVQWVYIGDPSRLPKASMERW